MAALAAGAYAVAEDRPAAARAPRRASRCGPEKGAQLIRILLADDHAIFRAGVKRVLEGAADLVIEAEAGSGGEALEQASLLAPDVAILDVSMPGTDILDTLRELKQRQPGLRILVLSVHPENHFAVRCLRQGADGYMTKDAPPEELIAAVRKVHGGGKYLTPRLTEQVLDALHEPDGAPRLPHAGLSRRQLEVLRLLGSGMTPTRIAVRLRLSVKTVSSHRQRILEKMRMSSTAELMRYAIERQLSAEDRPAAAIRG